VIIIKIDVSVYRCTGIILQYNNNRILYPIAFYLKKYPSMHYNYFIYDTELMAIIQSLEE
jgi:hypothetical protein